MEADHLIVSIPWGSVMDHPETWARNGSAGRWQGRNEVLRLDIAMPFK